MLHVGVSSDLVMHLSQHLRSRRLHADMPCRFEGLDVIRQIALRPVHENTSLDDFYVEFHNLQANLFNDVGRTLTVRPAKEFGHSGLQV